MSAAFLFLHAPHSGEGWVLLIAWLFVCCTVLFVLIAAAAYKWTTRPSARYPVADRFVTPREPEIDLAKEWCDYCARRDAYLEQQMLRRVG